MRTLLILGVLVICVLLVTPSDGDRTESQDGGGEKGTSDLRELVGQNEDGKANGIDASAHLRSRRQEPSSRNTPRKKKNCPGCFSSLSVEDAFRLPKRSRRQEKKQEPSSPNTPRKKKNCPGCFSSLDETRQPKRSRRQEKKNKKPSKKLPPPPSSFSLMARSARTSRDTKPKRSKKVLAPGTDGLEGKPNADFGTLEKTPEDQSRRERKKNGRKRSRGEKGERKLRKHHHHHPHHPHYPHHPHHHHPDHHPEGKKEELKRRRTGSRSAITSTYGERKDVSDGKEESERMKRQSEKGNRRRGKEERWGVGSRSPIASLPRG